MKALALAALCSAQCCAVAQTNISFTTLDGVAYSNVTVSVVRYDYILVVDSNSGHRVMFTNLPPRVAAQIHRPAQPPEAPAPPFNFDAFLAVHTDSELSESAILDDAESSGVGKGYDLTYSTFLWVNPSGFLLEASTTKYEHGSKTTLNTGAMWFQFGQEALATTVFAKFSKWDEIAERDHSETFVKLIGDYLDQHIFLTRRFEFSWDDTVKSKLCVSCITNNVFLSFNEMMDSRYTREKFFGSFNRFQVDQCSNLVARLPELKAKLSERIKHQEEQRRLFK